MELQVLPQALTVCKVDSLADANLDGGLFFVGKTDEETSLVCETSDAPARTLAREDGWRGLRIQGTLDFSLIGILSRIAAILADESIGIFVVSTYNTDYVLVKAKDLERALHALKSAGYEVV